VSGAVEEVSQDKDCCHTVTAPPACKDQGTEHLILLLDSNKSSVLY
jgi:hypothetical protein